ncbi:MAG: hypothetical protein JST90_01730 [Bacteroidetes bacterium]|nr:hypothetical protein [Bacteroidota bacterium]
MKEEEVPQDDANMLQGKFRKLYYATDGSAHYKGVGSVGWEPENVVLEQAWEDIRERVAEAKEKVLAGGASPVLYHMERTLMTPDILAGHIGWPAFVVRLHLRPFFFGRLGRKTLEKYAYAFQISLDELTDITKVK